VIEGPEAARGASSTGQALTPAQETQVRPGQAALLPALVRLGLGTVWSAQVGPETPRGFVLLVAGVPFEVPSPPPERAGASLVVRVVDDGPVPAFEVVTEPAAQLAGAAARAVIAGALERAVRERLDDVVRGAGLQPSVVAPPTARADGLDQGVVRIDVALPGPEPRLRCRVKIGERPAHGATREPAMSASVLIELPDGAVEACLLLAAGLLQVDLVVDSDRIAARLAAGERELARALADIGFGAAAVRTTVDAARIARDRAALDAPRATRPAGGLLDIHV
jgi:hypothetical protein